MYDRVAEALDRGETVVMDATFYKGFERRDFIQYVKSKETQKVEGIYFNVPLEVAFERNRMRERVVQKHVLERMQSWLTKEPPSLSDGFDSIKRVNENEILMIEERVY